MFSVYIPNLNQFDDILQEKSSSNPVYYRDPPSCQSLRENYFLDATDKRPLIVISVTTTAPTVPSSSSIHDGLTSLIFSQTVTTDTGPIPMTTTPSTQSAMSPSTSSSSFTSLLYSSSSQNTILSSSSSSSFIITTTNPTTTTSAFGENSFIFIGAGVIIVVVVILIAFLVLICLFVKFNRKKKAQPTLQSDSLDFHRIRAISPEMRQEIDEFRAPNRQMISSFIINDYDNPSELTFHDVNGSSRAERDYMTMISTTVPSRTVTPSRTTTPAYSRNMTPSNISNGSGGSHYQYPRNQSPSTNQRYDSPRSITTSSLSEYDDPRVLDRTPRITNKFGKSGTNPRRSQSTTLVTHTYQVLENPNKATGQAEHPTRVYHELIPTDTLPKNNDYHVLEKPGSGYHVPTRNQRESMILQGELQTQQQVQEFFLNKSEYFEPPEQTEHIYEQLNQYKCREIPLENITFDKEIGKGQFGTVFAGTWYLAGGDRRPVAIKRLSVQASEEEKSKFLREGARMMQFFHPNVVKLLGVATVHTPFLLVQELMSKGDLKSYLKGSRPQLDSNDPVPVRDVPSPQQLLKFCRDIASGMRHLVTKNFVHRDLAARNVLLNDNLICKIADFGMTRAANHVFDLNKTEQIPLRWTAPEAFKLKDYSEKSDVYSYGMVLYEIWSLGRKPFPRLYQNQEIVDFIDQRGLLPPPPGCPREVYSLMVTCWNPNPSLRMSFDSICNDYLKANDDSLLSWDKNDLEGRSSEATKIGAMLDMGYDLYTDLQKEYRL
uniref:Protein kinase domain-containing protein n=1 Tax=Amphimedon queenslandica TaxID=400682 RepID=A0A1X7VGF7_AMPQE